MLKKIRNLEMPSKISLYFKSLATFIKSRPTLKGQEFLNILDNIPSVLKFKDKHRKVWADAIELLKKFLEMEMDKIPFEILDFD